MHRHRSYQAGQQLMQSQMSLEYARVVFSYSSPLSFSSIWAPFLPVLLAVSVFLQTRLFSTVNLLVIDEDHPGGMAPRVSGTPDESGSCCNCLSWPVC